jgi:hypothetical protein
MIGCPKSKTRVFRSVDAPCCAMASGHRMVFEGPRTKSVREKDWRSRKRGTQATLAPRPSRAKHAS